jgi:hypothetical protein
MLTLRDVELLASLRSCGCFDPSLSDADRREGWAFAVLSVLDRYEGCPATCRCQDCTVVLGED